MVPKKESQKEWNKNIISAYSKVLRPVPKIASGLLSLGFLGYILGWIRAHAYFSQFGAEWILASISTMHLINLSIFPILTILISLILTMTDIAERLVGENLNKTVFFLIGGFVVMNIGSLILDYYSNYQQALILVYIQLCYSAGILTMVFGESIIHLRQTNYRWDSQKIWQISIWTFLFILSVSSLGSAEGKLDSIKSTSELPIVNLKSNEKDQEWRLLNANNVYLYITIPSSEESKIKIVKTNEISYIK